MALESIPQARWSEFLTSFSRMHAGWLVTLESLPANRAPRRLLHEVALVAVTVDADRILIGVDAGVGHVDHVIERPVALGCARSGSGVDQGLEIETGAGERLRLRFRSAVPPELVDGV